MPDINRKQPNEQQKKASDHVLTLTGREKLNICGVTDVVSFDSSGVELETVQGCLSVEGTDLRMDALDTESGVVEINGRIDSVVYADRATGEKKSIFKRFFAC